MNLFLTAIDNLLFLWYPTRAEAGQLDLAMMGRMTLVLSAKLLGTGLGVGAAAGVGALAFFASGRNGPVALGAGWVVLTALALAMVPWVGHAFEGYDVAGDTPA